MLVPERRNDARFQKRTSERSTAEIVEPTGAKTRWDDVAMCLQNMVARDGVELPEVLITH
jgi:hypothetical protein